MRVRTSPETAWRNFRDLVEQRGGRVIEEQWLGTDVPHRLICARGHEASVWPSNAKRAGRICAACSHMDRPDYATARERFYEQVEAGGGRVIEPRWLGNKKRHRIVCAAGHEAAPVPVAVARTGGICPTCAGNNPAVSERAFHSRLAEAPAELLEPYVNSHTPVLVRCAEGHQAKRTPSSFKEGKGCRVCAGNDQQSAWQHFCAIITGRGGQVLEPGPLGNSRQHRVLCPKGHETKAIPQIVRIGGGMCGECSPVSRTRAEREFREIVAGLGGRIVEPSWLGAVKPHRVICADGHEVRVRPNDVQQGHGLCRKCAHKFWDVFYVVTDERAQVVKFGITSHDARRRLRTHRKAGFGTVIMAVAGLEGAPELEQSVISALRLAGLPPVRGREYFGITALPVILDIADNWTRASEAA